MDIKELVRTPDPDRGEVKGNTVLDEKPQKGVHEPRVG